MAGEVVTWFQEIPSQWKSVTTSLAGHPPVQQSFGPVQNTDFRKALGRPIGEVPPGIVGVATGDHFVPSQEIITGPAENELWAWMPPTAQPLVGLNMKIEVRFASLDSAGVPLTATTFQLPTPEVTV